MSEEQEIVTKNVKKFSLRLIIVFIILLVSAAIFAWIVDEIVLEDEHRFDYLVFEIVDKIASASLTQFMIGITFFGSSTFLFPAYTFLVVYFLTYGRNKQIAFTIAAIGISSRLLQVLLKTYFRRERPAEPLIEGVEGFSFPSGHSFSGFTFFGLLIYVLWNYNMNPVLRWSLSVLFFLIASTIAFSRVYLHVHYASDVIGGFFLCIVWLTISFWISKKLSSKYKL